MPKARVKLLTLWFGDLPPWIDKFRDRMSENRIIDWEVIQPSSVEDFNRLVSEAIHTPCCKKDGYSLGGDTRPLYGDLFSQLYRDYEYWGWCDLDVVVGDLDRLLPPLLRRYSIVSTCPTVIHGPLTFLRNTPEICSLYKQTDYKKMLATPDYCNFDESGFNEADQIKLGIWNSNENFTRVVNTSGLRVRYDSRSWTESQEYLPETRVPTRCCILNGDRLIEIPTGRELLMYHFASKGTEKKWPIPNRYSSALKYQQEWIRNPVLHDPAPIPAESPKFWGQRVKKMLENQRPLHTCSYDTTMQDWVRIQRHSAGLIKDLFEPGESILDAGCGYGALIEVIEWVRYNLVYAGVDFCPEMIHLAKLIYPKRAESFMVGDIREMRDMPLVDQLYPFDWCICRGLEGSIKTILGNDQWDLMVKEMLRVAKRLLVIDMNCNHRVLE